MQLHRAGQARRRSSLRASVTTAALVAATIVLVATFAGPALATTRPPGFQAAPVVGGQAEIGGVLFGHAGTIQGTRPLAPAFGWHRCPDGPHDGQPCPLLRPTRSYALTEADRFSRLYFEVTVQNAAGSATARSGELSGITDPQPGPITNAELPVVTGLARVGDVLDASEGFWTAPNMLAYSFQWFRCAAPGDCAPIDGAADSNYAPKAADVGQQLFARVSAADIFGSSVCCVDSPLSHPVLSRYAGSVLNDAPTAYWRLSEDTSATTAQDASGHGNTLAYAAGYASTNLPGTESVVVDDDGDSSIYPRGATVATQSPATIAPQPAFEGWIRPTVVPSGPASFYSYTDAYGNVVEDVRVTPSGSVEAVYRNAGSNAQTVVSGPPASVIDGEWHYVVVDFPGHALRVDGVPGTDATTAWSPCGPPACAAGSASQAIGSPAYTGHVDEFALYTSSLPDDRAAAHEAARGVSPTTSGGEEGVQEGCAERGVFVLGVPSVTTYPQPHPNFLASGAVNDIDTELQAVACAAPRANGSTVPTFTSGQTVRVKFGGLDVVNSYAEFGPVQFYCGTTMVPCWGLFWDFKLNRDDNRQDYFPKPLFEPFAVFKLRGGNAVPCGTPLGRHGYKVQHEPGFWVGYFTCAANLAPGSTAWVEFARTADANPDVAGAPAVTSGFPDTEAFEQGLAYQYGKVADSLKWLYEGEMAAPHFRFQLRDTSATPQWQNVPAAACHKDNSYRYDGRKDPQSSAPITVEMFENHRIPQNPALGAPGGIPCGYY